jgi:hypothetical protein
MLILYAICEPIVWRMSEPQHLTTVWASTGSYRDSFTFFSLYFFADVSECDSLNGFVTIVDSQLSIRCPVFEAQDVGNTRLAVFSPSRLAVNSVA